MDASGIIANISVDGINDSVKIYCCVAACFTLLAGILLLALFSLETRINWMFVFFLVSGFFQIFWVVPIIKKMGKLLVLCRYGGVSNFDCRLCRIPYLSAGDLD